MKRKTFKIFSFILSVVILCNTFYCTAHASDPEIDAETQKKMKEFEDSLNNTEKWKKTENSFWTWILSNGGAIFHGDMAQIRENQEQLDKELSETWDNPEWRKENITIVTENGVPRLKISKNASQLVLDITKKANKEPDNGGYELLKTVPASKISSLYFNNPTHIKSMYNLLNDNNGIIGLGYIYGDALYYKIPENIFFVKRPSSYNYMGTLYDFICTNTYQNMVSGVKSYTGFRVKGPDSNIVSGWNDVNLYNGSSNWNKSFFALYDSFSFWTNLQEGKNPMNVTGWGYIVTNSGVSIPVFNTIDDAVAYSVANNLYYTSSDYTGEGKEIIIEFDQIDNITNGYYDDMYALLQQLIEQKGGNSLTPEQLQQIVDDVRASFGLLKDEINKGFQQQDILIQKNSGILQNIADALNEFFRQTKEFREYMDKMFSDFINGQKYTPPNTEPSTEPGTGTDTGDGTDDTGGGLLKKLYDTVKSGFEDAVKELKKIKRWTALDTIIDGAGFITDIITFVTDLLDPDKAADAVAEFVANGADALAGVKELVDGKFPFCIPVDILVLMQTLAHEPETPRFEIPFVLERYGIEEKVVIDLKDFQIISDISRTFLTILWCCTLMNLTTKITDMKSI